MHKIFLTEEEVSFISGAETIVDELGGFPSMEDGSLIKVCIEEDGYKQFVSLVFDITGWIKNAGYYIKIPATSKRRIKIVFSGKFDLMIVGNLRGIQGEIKFGNQESRPMEQDDLPGYAPIIKRPFSVFCVRNERNLCIEFFEEYCCVSASFED